MTTPPAGKNGQARSRGLWSYNLRILLGNSYWLIVTPVAAAQLVLLWNMATVSMFTPERAVQTTELVAPLLAAFLCAHALAPEQAGVRELVIVRPVSLEKILLVRLTAMFSFVLALIMPALLIYYFGLKPFPFGRALLSGLPSLLFLSTLSMAVATGTRAPLLGFAAAAAYWVLDLALGNQFNPLVTLHGFSDFLANRPLSDQWVAGKIILLALAGLLYLWNRRLLSRPPGPRRWATTVRVGAALVLVLFLYVASGAACKIAYGIRSEKEAPSQSYFWYKQQFQTYGPLPIARLFGPAFAFFMQAKSGVGAAFTWSGSPLPTPAEIANMARLIQLYPKSIWADNAAFEIARSVGRRPAQQPWVVELLLADQPARESELVPEDLPGGVKAFEEFAAAYPASAFAPNALSQAAQMAVRTLDFGVAIADYQKLLKEFPQASESSDAGLALSRLYLAQGRWQDALHAADIASAVAAWDLKGEVLLAAARAAERLGDENGARTRYQQAHAAAKQSRQSASGRRRSPHGMSGGEVVLRADATMRACEQALARKQTPLASQQPPPGLTLTGTLLHAGKGIADVRVALAGALDEREKLTPFVDAPTAQGVTDPHGQFTLTGVRPGEYTAIAVAYRQLGEARFWQLKQPPLPIRVGGLPMALPPLTMASKPATPPRLRSGGGPDGSDPGSAGGGRAQRGGRRSDSASDPSSGSRGGSRGGGRGGSRSRGGGRRGGSQDDANRGGQRGGAR
jgi:tetratricopeptide (TPR) repeat protein